MDILSFSGRYRFLSNFWPAEVTLDGKTYATVEHAYQAAKTLDAGQREYIRSMPSPGKAKSAGKSVTIRNDWEEIKVDIMLDLVRQKFSKQPIKSLLLETGKSLLVEGNTWNDRFWGVCNGEGKNHLGNILMKVRDELKT